MNIKKYHKNIYFEHEKELQDLIKKLNNYNKISISYHAKQRISDKIPKNKWYLLHNILIEKINFNDIIEYTIINNIIDKILIRKNFNKTQDILLSISNNKKIITIYLNNSIDSHFTLNKNNYVTYH